MKHFILLAALTIPTTLFATLYIEESAELTDFDYIIVVEFTDPAGANLKQILDGTIYDASNGHVDQCLRDAIDLQAAMIEEAPAGFTDIAADCAPLLDRAADKGGK